ncbi:uncharacterized protein L3040_003586 [Drepanopeziza brunnea f. sp. 'multigermtubi']|uniref:Cellulosomal protein n=1 Tax=Marssonina brunnea f. sp. multigermtubi (strain MB_m1) TaxID=1072389 RepID=K1WTM3_MARBU|nr:cellulosomal protein [Drepanopeziza brunnea f. sp. 'multigermtubi' MB_m1]EKD15797.1 cellulosomal protein [Drepanopeziza brunnea f. sp. 'multigermtubi' MB_m1]KAJ5046341.1 hypothetical protein L3040_003586 [Drepanopeziza brunnea f. sp. 'multigermtubi']
MSKIQERLNHFYDIDNLVTVEITMPPKEWESLMACEPRGGICNFDYVGGPRFDWYKATKVTFSGSRTPYLKATFKDVGIIKKSYCGSFSTTKPSVRLDFDRNLAAQGDAVEKLIGTKSLTLNNCKQDPAYIRQPLGYELLRLAGVPAPRCNFAKLIVNGTDMGAFVNLEQYKKQFLKNNFEGNDDGNLYELDAGDDLDREKISMGKISFEGGVADDQKDLLLAADAIKKGGLAAAKKVIDYNAFIKLYAMETILKHRDGFTINTNNTYLYNDVKAVAEPTTDDVNLKFIPCGIDQILRDKKDFEIGGTAILARLIRDDPDGIDDLLEVMRRFATIMFSRSHYESTLGPYVNRLAAVAASAGAQLADEINSIHVQLRLVRSGAYQHLGEYPAEELVFVARNSSEGDGSIPASSEEYVPEPTTSTFGEDWFKTGYFTLKSKTSGCYVSTVGATGTKEVSDKAQAGHFYLY